MRRDLLKYPDVVFVDTTYKLFRRNFKTQIVGVGILADEQYSTLRCVFERFKEDNQEACAKIGGFMTDKDLTERSAITDVFVNGRLMLCKFHTKKAMKLALSNSKIQMSTNQRKVSLKIIDKLVESSSQEDYDQFCKELKEKASEGVKKYFFENWHDIRAEWTRYGLVENSLGNSTNNRIESLNFSPFDELEELVQDFDERRDLPTLVAPPAISDTIYPACSYAPEKYKNKERRVGGVQCPRSGRRPEESIFEDLPGDVNRK
ncbi:uncharacterized protein [Fopius arisanus]|uniref:ZSWIM1/3 RNaseH-like domain-containing protein n=1 Tax=Fopius arisanus TaxID=64838 RepID=A0A9R1U9J1_9HYME|nr:PREDICTED: uncharacterized protein LOC105272792 [Fopius arisanus]